MPKTEPQSTFFNVMPEAAGAKPRPVQPRKVNAAGADKIFGTTKAAPTVLNMSGASKASFFKTKKLKNGK